MLSLTEHVERGAATRVNCWDQFLCMVFAQLPYRESLRDINACLRAVQPRIYHLGIRARVARSTLADANEMSRRQKWVDAGRHLAIPRRRTEPGGLLARPVQGMGSCRRESAEREKRLCCSKRDATGTVGGG